MKKKTYSSLVPSLATIYSDLVPLIEATDNDAVYVDGEPTVAESGFVVLFVLPFSEP